MEILDLRHFSSDDLRPLLDDETRTWSQLLSWDYHGSADMILRYVDTKILPGYAAIDRGRIFGYTFFVYEGSKGVIGDLYVSNGEKHDANDVERQLLRHVIETLQQSPGIHRIEAQLLVHETGAVAEPFATQGFSLHHRLFMMRPLESTRAVALFPPNEEIEIRPWSEHDYDAVAGLITNAYRGHVDSQINDQYRSLSGSIRFLNNIVRFPGCGIFDAESSFIAKHKKTRSLAGVILCSRVRYDVGHVTQVCVLPEYRSLGIGQQLIAATTASLQRRKFVALSLTVTEANNRAVELYQRLGFETKRIFDAFVWED